jgi:hypothetical protein
MFQKPIAIYPVSLDYNLWRIRARTKGMKRGSSFGKLAAKEALRQHEVEFVDLCKSAFLVSDTVTVADLPEIIPNSIDFLEDAATQLAIRLSNSPEGVATFLNEQSRGAAAAELSTSKEREDFDTICELLFPAQLSDSVILSPDPMIGGAALIGNPEVGPDNVLMILAACGIRIRLPAVFAADWKTLSQVKEKYAEERHAYISFMRGFVDECHLRIKAQDYADAYEYARWKSNQEVLALCSGLELAVARSSKSLLQRVAVGIVKGLPEIADAFPNPTRIGTEILKVLCESIVNHKEGQFKEFKDVAYVYKLSKSMQSNT